MVTTFNSKDIISFGNFLLRQVENGSKQPEPDGQMAVTHADFENWKEEVDRVRQGTVRAKFSCWSIESEQESVLVTLSAVTSEGQGENADYSKYTPYGEVKIQIDKGTRAFDFFEQGESYYIDFKKA